MKYAVFHIILIVSCLSFHAVSGQVSVIKSECEGREAYSLQNNKMRISLLTGGGFIAELRLITSNGNESVNPMFIPHYRTIDPHNYTPELHKDLYGSDINGRLMAGYMGHFLCFPYFGDPNPEWGEKCGHSTHGEAFAVKYEIEKESKGPGAVVRASAVLPLTKYSIKRSLTMLPGQSVVLVNEVIENLESVDRPYQYVQHLTFGLPFIEKGKTFVDAPVSRIAFSEQKDDPLNQNRVQWPVTTMEGGNVINTGVFGSDKGEGGYRAWLMDPDRELTWLTIYNPGLKLLVGYIFRKDENPWIGDWQENQHARGFPRNGKTIAWGLEVGTSPFPSGIKQSIERGLVFDTETYRWIGAGEKKEQSYLIFLLEIDVDFKGVKELKLEKGAITLTENETTKQINIASDFTLNR